MYNTCTSAPYTYNACIPNLPYKHMNKFRSYRPKRWPRTRRRNLNCRRTEQIILCRKLTVTRCILAVHTVHHRLYTMYIVLIEKKKKCIIYYRV